MAKLYELTGEFLELMDMIDDPEVDQEMLQDTLEGIDYEIELKADGYAKIIRNLESDVEGIKNEVKRLQSKQKTYENRIKCLKDNLKSTMEVTNKRKFKTKLFSFGIQRKGGKAPLVIDVDLDKIPDEFKIHQPDKIDGDAVREFLKTDGLPGKDGGIYSEYFHLEPRGEYLSIR